MENGYIDTHCHLDMMLERFQCGSFKELRDAYYPENFAGCVTISCDPGSIERTLNLMDNQDVYGAFGIHPHEAKYYDDRLEDRIRAALAHPKALAWGETGLDYHYHHSPPGKQRSVFVQQIQQGVKLAKPLIIHSREAEEDTLNIMRDNMPGEWEIHLHCFTGSADTALNFIQEFPRLFIGFTGAVTFKEGSEIQETVKAVPLERMLLETDAPYMAPVPYRGKPSHSGHIPLIAEKIAALKNISIEEVYFQTWKNAQQMYKNRVGPS